MLRVLLTASTVFIVCNVFTPILSTAIYRNGMPILSNLPYCGANTISKPCGDNCQKMCEPYESRYCKPSCIINGCVCIPGYIRKNENGPCIPEAWCKLGVEEWNGDERLYFRTYEDQTKHENYLVFVDLYDNE